MMSEMMMRGERMSGGRMPQGMMAHHLEMENLVEPLGPRQDFLKNEKDPQILKEKLAELRALREELQSKLPHRSEMMPMMKRERMQQPPMMGTE